MTSTASCKLRATSVSSIRSTNVPPVCRAYSQLNRAVRAPPMCKNPVGLGAKRTRTFISSNYTLPTRCATRHGKRHKQSLTYLARPLTCVASLGGHLGNFVPRCGDNPPREDVRKLNL